MQQLSQQDTQPKQAPAARRRAAATDPQPIMDREAAIEHLAEEEMLRTIALYLRDGKADLP